ncbi:MAG: GntR family transcriptional regulator [Planctomycetaceae bacterium]
MPEGSLANGNGHYDHGGRRRLIVESLLADVFQGRLHSGQHLVTQRLADRFGMSHTPIREALITLSGMGVVDLLPNRGALVRRVTARDVREVLQVRRALECEAVRRACGRIDLSELHKLAGALRRMAAGRHPAGSRAFEQARTVDSYLHDLIANSSGNGFLAKELNRLKALFRAFRDVSYTRHIEQHDTRRIREEAREHLEIVDALIANSPRAAARAMSRHLHSGVKYWSRSLPEIASTTPRRTVSRPRSSARRQPLRARKR